MHINTVQEANILKQEADTFYKKDEAKKKHNSLLEFLRNIIVEWDITVMVLSWKMWHERNNRIFLNKPKNSLSYNLLTAVVFLQSRKTFAKGQGPETFE